VQVSLDDTRCQGHTLCAMIAPESFALDDIDGRAHAVVEDVPERYHQSVREAANSCPEQAISVLVDRMVTARSAHGRPQGT
jgi:ferredoxin